MFLLALGQFLEPARAAIDFISASDTEIIIHPTNDTGALVRIAELEPFEQWDSAKGWTNLGPGTSVAYASNGIALVSFQDVPGFSPFIGNSTRLVQAAYVSQLALRARMRGYTGEGTVPWQVVVTNPTNGDQGTLDFVIVPDNQWRIIRLDLTNVQGLAWADQRSLGLSLAAGVPAANCAGAALEVDWLAVTDDPAFNPDRSYTSYDLFWDLGYPVPSWEGTPRGEIILPRFQNSRDRLFTKFQMTDATNAPLGSAKFVTDLSGLSHLQPITDTLHGWVSAGEGAGTWQASNGIAGFTYEDTTNTFDPQLSNMAEAVNAEKVRYFAMRARVVNYGGTEASVPCNVRSKSSTDPYIRHNSSIDPRGAWQIVRIDLGANASYTNTRYLRIDIPDTGDTYKAPFLPARTEIDWIAVTADSAYDGTQAPGSNDVVWHFQIPASDRNFAFARPASIKGLDGSWFEDHVALNTKYAKLHIRLNNLIDFAAKPAITWHVDGQPVGIKKSFSDSLAADVKRRTDAGQSIFLTVLLGNVDTPKPGNPLYNIRTAFGETPNPYGAFNMADPQGILHFRAALEYLAWLFSDPSGANGYVEHFTLANEVDAHWSWYNIGNAPMQVLVDNYTLVCRIADLAVRKFHPQMRVYACITKHWNDRPLNGLQAVNTKAFLDAFNARNRAEGNFPWQLAQHPYSQNMADPRFWLDTDAPLDFNASYCSYKNAEMLHQYLRQKHYLYEGQPREIAQTEQGFGENIAGETMQAAGYCYAWYKMSHLPYAGPNIHHRQLDSDDENATYGVWAIDTNGNPTVQRQQWQCIKDADTPAWETTFAPYLPYLPFTNWNEAVAAHWTIDFFFTNGSMGGWTAKNYVTNLASAGDTLSGTVTGPDPQLERRRCFFITDNLEKILIRMRTSSGATGQLFWTCVGDTNYSPAKSQAFSLLSDSQPHDYLLDLSTNQQWLGKQILSLRLDPINNAVSNATFAIAFMVGGSAERDFDRDGVPDAREKAGDTDGYGLPDFADPDSPPPSLGIVRTNNNFRLQISTGTGAACRVDTTTNLASPSWQPVYTNYAPTAVPFFYLAPSTLLDPQRFYRVVPMR